MPTINILENLMHTTFIPTEMPSKNPQHLQAVATTQGPRAGGSLVLWAFRFTIALVYSFSFFAIRIMGNFKKQTDTSGEDEGGGKLGKK